MNYPDYDRSNKYYPSVTNKGSYIEIYKSSSDYIVLHGYLAGVYISPAIDVSPYKTIKLTYETVDGIHSSVSSGNCYAYIGGCTSTPTHYGPSGSTYGLRIQGTDYSNSALIGDEGTYTLSLDVSSISTSLYIYAGVQQPSYTAYYWEVDILKIEIS